MKITFLTEGIDEVKKYYPNIEDSIFNSIIQADPTSNMEKDKAGKYSKWLLTMYSKGNLKVEDLYKATEYINRFETLKSRFTNKDINQFKTLPDLFVALEEVENTELSAEEKKKQMKKDAHNAHKDIEEQADKVFESANWIIWNPKTHAADCALGRGTQWCTATTDSDYYFNHYNSEGPLYIFINKNDPSVKYQLHWKSRQFMDASDSSVDINDFLLENLELKDEVRSLILKEDTALNAAIKRGYAEVPFDRAAECLHNVDESSNRRDSISSDFYAQILSGELSMFDYYDPYTGPECEIPTLTEENAQILKSLGYDCTKLTTLGDLTDEAEFSDVDENTLQEVYAAFTDAYSDADIAGCESEIYNQFKTELSKAIPSCTMDYDKLTLKFTTNEDAIFGCLDETESYDEKGFYDINEQLFIANLDKGDFRFTEPSYGWVGFDNNVFNESLNMRLNEDVLN